MSTRKEDIVRPSLPIKRPVTEGSAVTVRRLRPGWTSSLSKCNKPESSSRASTLKIYSANSSGAVEELNSLGP